MSKFLLVAFLLLPIMSVSKHSSDQSIHMLPKLINDNGDDFIVIAHRGASAYYPENTMAAFRGAVEMGAEMIELDVMLSKDGVPVVFHDAVLDEHTNGTGPLTNYTLEELKRLDAGSWFDSKFSDEQIPTLEEVLKFARGKIALNIEIKPEGVTHNLKKGIEEKALDLVKKYGMQQHVLFSSFDYRAIQHLNLLDPLIPVALLYEARQAKKRLPSQLLGDYNADAFNCSYNELSRKRLRDIRLHNIPLFVYTINTSRRMKKLIELGVRGIFSNKPDLLNKVANSLQRH